MKIEHATMFRFYKLAKRAELGQIKHLNQKERKMLQAMLRGLKKGEAFIELKKTQEKDLAVLESKLSIKVVKKPSALLLRVIKICLNILGIRISSNKIMREIRYVDSVMAEKNKELAEVKRKLQEMQEQITRLTQESPMPEQEAKFEQYRKRAELLSLKKNKLEQFLQPANRARVEALKQRVIRKKKEIKAIQEEFLLPILKRCRRKFLPEEVAEYLEELLKKNMEHIENGHVSLFRKDLTRVGNVVTISDPAKGIFRGKQLTDACKPQDHLQYHIEGLSKICGEHEKKWLHLLETNMTQTVPMALTDPVCMLITVLGQEWEGKRGGYYFQFNNKWEQRRVNIDVVRDEYGVISRCDVKAYFLNFLDLVPEDRSKGNLPIPVSALESTMSYSVTFTDDGVTPKVTGLKYKHSLKPYSIPEPAKMPESGFVAVSDAPSEELAAGGEYTVDHMVHSWRSDLSKLRLDTRPTKDKITYLKGRIHDIEGTLSDRRLSSLQRDSINLVLQAYHKYLDLLSQ